MLAPHPRFHVYFTSTGASWINLVERWFAALTEKQLRRKVHRSTRRELETAIRQDLETTNGKPKPFVGPKRLTKSSRTSHDFVSEFLTQDTRWFDMKQRCHNPTAVAIKIMVAVEFKCVRSGGSRIFLYFSRTWGPTPPGHETVRHPTLPFSVLVLTF